MLKQLFVGAALSAVVLTAAAAAAPAAPAAPDQVVRETTEKMQALIREHHKQYAADQESFYKVVDDILVPRFDVRYIAQLVLGRNWRAASEEQRNRFTQAFKLMLIRSYANTLLEYYDSVKADWQPLRMAPDVTDVTVRTTLTRDNGQPLPIGFSMHRVDAEWKVYDISVEAISLVANFRSQFTAEIKRTSLDDVIARMEGGDPAFKAAAVKPGA